MTIIIPDGRPSLYFWPKSAIMSVIILLIAASILIAGGFLVAFLWSVKNGQYDDDYTPSIRMLFDDAPPAGDLPENPTKNPQTNM